jgi:hypothetical protein
MLLNHGSIKQTQQKPIVLQWLCDPCNVCDPKTNFNDLNDDNKSQTGSYTSHISPTEEQEKILQSIYRLGHSDKWACKNCNLRDDKWGMIKHSCKASIH